MIDWDHGFPNIAKMPGSDMHFSTYSYPMTSDVHCFCEISTLWNSFFFLLNKGLRRKKWCICLSQLMRKCRIFLITLCFEKWTLSGKTDTQFERCQLSFIWGKMRTAVQETASQRTLRNCSKETVGESQYVSLVKGEFNAIKHLLYKRFPASREELKSSFSGLVLF